MWFIQEENYWQRVFIFIAVENYVVNSETCPLLTGFKLKHSLKICLCLKLCKKLSNPNCDTFKTDKIKQNQIWQISF